MTDIMIDLETMDTKPSAVVLSIGMVEFDPAEGTVDKDNGQLLFPSIQEQLDAGRTISAATLQWWMGQTDGAKADWVVRKKKSVTDTRNAVRSWMSTMRRPTVWGNGSVFDITMMEDFMDHTQIPWKFWDVMDTRTHHRHFPFDKSKKGVTAHTALDDAIAQAERVCETWPK